MTCDTSNNCGLCARCLFENYEKWLERRRDEGPKNILYSNVEKPAGYYDEYLWKHDHEKSIGRYDPKTQTSTLNKDFQKFHQNTKEKETDMNSCDCGTCEKCQIPAEFGREIRKHVMGCPECLDLAENYNHLVMEGKDDDGATEREIKNHMEEAERSEFALEQLRAKLTGTNLLSYPPVREGQSYEDWCSEYGLAMSEEAVKAFYDKKLSKTKTNDEFIVEDILEVVEDMGRALETVQSWRESCRVIRNELTKAEETYDEAMRKYEAIRSRFIKLNRDLS